MMYFRMFLLLTCTWLIPASWVAMSPPFMPSRQHAQVTRERLTKLKMQLHRYAKTYKTTPASLANLRAFAYAGNDDFDAYDTLGQRFAYMRLDDKHFIMRSFGADGLQNRLNSNIDMGVVNWGIVPASNPSYAYDGLVKPSIFPAALLAGSSSPDKQWLARLFIDNSEHTRQLLIRHLSRGGLFMAAPHDRVEEFLWLPNSAQIIYTATGSSRHRDGLFLWDLHTDTVTNLIDVVSREMPLSPAAKARGLWLSLGGIRTTPSQPDAAPLAYVFFAPRQIGSLNPEVFFSAQQLLSFSIDTKDPQQSRITDTPQDILNDALAPYAKPLRLDAQIALSGIKQAGLEAQKRWLGLSLNGEMEETLLTWHNFIEREATSPLFPYGLFLLSSLYSESYSLLRESNERDADVLRSYGTEIARALVQTPAAPTYLQGLALHTYEQLMAGRTLPYRLAQLTTHDATLPAAMPVAIPVAPITAPPAIPAKPEKEAKNHSPKQSTDSEEAVDSSTRP